MLRASTYIYQGLVKKKGGGKEEGRGEKKEKGKKQEGRTLGSNSLRFKSLQNGLLSYAMSGKFLNLSDSQFSPL